MEALFHKVADLPACNFLKKRLAHRCFPVVKILKTPFEKHLRTAGSDLTLRSDFFGTLFLDSRFQNHPDAVILQKYQSLSNQSFKDYLVHMPSLYLTLRFFNLGFVCSSLTVNTQKANACSPWTPCFIQFTHFTQQPAKEHSFTGQKQLF